MKEFNLRDAKAGKPVCTRDGKPARIVCWDRKWQDYPLLGLVMGKCGEESAMRYCIDGKTNPGRDTANDLMMVGEKKEGWINLCKEIPEDDGTFYSPMQREINGTIYPTIEEAKEAKEYECGCVATIRIEWEE